MKRIVSYIINAQTGRFCTYLLVCYERLRTMYIEIQEAVSFLCSFLYDKIPRRQIDLFAVHFANNLFHKYVEHWNESDPVAEADHRRIEVNVSGYTDKLLMLAANHVMLDVEELLAHLPAETVVFVSPSMVSARKGGTSASDVVYPAPEEPRLCQPGLCRPKLRVKCVVDPSVDDKYTCEVFELEIAGQTFSADTFAQTRFGSMKVKSHVRGASSSSTSSRSAMQSSRFGSQSAFLPALLPAVASSVPSYYAKPTAAHSAMSLTNPYYGMYTTFPSCQQPPVNIAN